MTKSRRFIGLIWGSITLIALVITIILFSRQYLTSRLKQVYSSAVATSDATTSVASEFVPYPSPISRFSLSLTATSSSLLYPPPPSPLPPQPTQPPPPPLCQFTSDVALETQAASDVYYSFSEPKIVRESSQNIEIVEWLPDNHRVLITQEEYSLQNIELFDPKTKEIQNLASRRFVRTPPVWISSENAVLYTELKLLDDTKTPVIFTPQLWMSNKDTGQLTKIAEEISSLFIAADLKTDRYVYLGTRQLITHSPNSGSNQAVEIDPWLRTSPAVFCMIWRPDSSKIAFCSNQGVFLVDADKGDVCKLDRTGWVLDAHWSPDGRYLALISSSGDPMYNPSELVILDIETGKTYSISVVPDANRERYVTDIAWAPDNRHLIIVGEYYPAVDVREKVRGIYLVDILRGSSISIASSNQFGGGGWGTNIAWSPDGSKLIVACPTEKVDRLCLIDVQQKALP